MFAATSPTCCLSIPSTVNLVGDSTWNVIPSGGLTGTGWLYPVANADYLQRLAIALGHPGDHVGDERPGQPVQRADLALVAWPGHRDHAVGVGDLDRLGDLHAERARRAPD